MAGPIGSSSEDSQPIAGINVTPFVDVVLVLLVIFMITAPALVKDALSIHLPQSETAGAKILKTFGIAVTRQGQILLDGNLVSPEVLKSEAKTQLEKDPELQALISADGDARHSDVVRAIDLIQSAGIKRFAIQIDHAQPR